jgi:hypothetical protein
VCGLCVCVCVSVCGVCVIVCDDGVKGVGGGGCMHLCACLRGSINYV